MNDTKPYDTLLRAGLDVAARVLGHQDRNAVSATAGVFGRRFWAWKTASMADASNLYGVLYLARAWTLDAPGNPLFHSPAALEGVLAGMRRWMTLQHADGSCDQVFPHEHSVGAAAYTALAVAEAMDILGGALDAGLAGELRAALGRTARFLLANDEDYGFISNHVALFAYANVLLHRATGEQRCLDKARSQVRAILGRMSPEGWFLEYNGADPGYQTQCLHYLARLADLGMEELRGPLERSVEDFLAWFVHPDGSLGGRYGCRNTAIAYPGGLASLAGRSPVARRMLEKICGAVEAGTTPAPSALDYPNAVRLGANYLEAWSLLREARLSPGDAGASLPCERDEAVRDFPGAGLCVRGTKAYYAVCAPGKGGVAVVFDKRSGARVLDHPGYAARRDGAWASTQWLKGNAFELEGDAVLSSHHFRPCDRPAMSPFAYWALLGLGMTAFRLRFAREAFKRYAVRRLITGLPASVGRLERTVRFGAAGIVVEDSIVPGPGRWEGLSGTLPHATIHMASSNYFDLGADPGGDVWRLERVPPSGARLRVVLDFTGDEPAMAMEVIDGPTGN